MSSLTKTQFATELQARSPVLNSYTGSEVEAYIDIALRAFSRRRPYKKTSPDNSVVADQEFYDFPTDAMRIINIVNVVDQKPIHFVVADEDDGEGQKIRLGDLQTRSTYDLMTQEFYRNPVSYQAGASIGSYSEFDIVYLVLQTMTSIKDDWIEALSWHVIFSAATAKSETAAIAVAAAAQEEATSITDQDATGASTTIKFSTSSDTAKTYSDMAKAALKEYNLLTKRNGYGMRG